MARTIKQAEKVGGHWELDECLQWVWVVDKLSHAECEDFSWNAIEQSIREMLADAKRRTGATDEEIAMAFSEVAKRVIDKERL